MQWGNDAKQNQSQEADQMVCRDEKLQAKSLARIDYNIIFNCKVLLSFYGYSD